MKGSYSVPIGSSRSPLMRVRQAERRQQDEQVHLGDAELDVLALGRELPVEGRGDALALEGVGHRLAREQAAAVDPGPEIGGDGHVRRGGDDAAREVAVAAADLVEDARRSRSASTSPAGWRPAALPARRSRGALSRRAPAGGERHAVEKCSASLSAGSVEAFELVPFVARAARPSPARNVSICAGVIRPA